jgi:hypothetical protein
MRVAKLGYVRVMMRTPIPICNFLLMAIKNLSVRPH